VLGASVTDLIIGAELANVGGVIGSLFFPWLQKKLGWNCRAIIIMLCFLYSLLPIYGLVAFNSIAEFWGSAFYHGLLLGASENACRVQFCELIPPGHEAEFFALYEIVDKGSAWIGPLAIGIINEKTGNFRNAFIFLLVFLLLPVIPFWFMKSEKGKHDAYEFVGLHEE
jgi:UMF1 family MFS transporter